MVALPSESLESHGSVDEFGDGKVGGQGYQKDGGQVGGRGIARDSSRTASKATQARLFFSGLIPFLGSIGRNNNFSNYFPFCLYYYIFPFGHQSFV